MVSNSKRQGHLALCAGTSAQCSDQLQLEMQTGLSVSAVELSLAVLFAADCTCVKGIARLSRRKSCTCSKSLLMDTVQTCSMVSAEIYSGQGLKLCLIASRREASMLSMILAFTMLTSGATLEPSEM